jgi:hypothetical protein
MSGIFDQVINYAPPSLLKGTVTYKGTWSADTNTPTLINPPDSTTNGFYYVVSAAGTQFSLSFNIGDWIISNGSTWEKVDNTDAVSSVFGRTGAVVGVSTDYSAVGITNTALGASNPSTVAATTVTATSTIAATGAVTGSNLSGTNTGDQTITLTGGVTGSGTGSFAATVVTNANLTGDVTSSGNVTTLTNAPVIAKVLTGYTSGAGTVAATDSILQAIQKLNGNDGTNANLTGVITSVGNATSIASQTGTGSTFVVSGSPTITTPVIAQINDASTNATLKLASIASAVNQVTIENSATGNSVHIRATGGDASVGLHLVAKGSSGYVNVTDGVDETKRILFNASGGTTATRTMLSSTQTVDRTISLPDATDTLVGKATTDTLTNKTLTSPTMTAPVLGTPASGTLTNCTFPTLNQNTTGTAANVTGTVLIANGGTSSTTAAAALTALGAYPSANPSGYTSNTGTVTGVTGTAPVVSSGGTAPAISMAAASSGVNGYMTGTYATKLDGIATGATANTGTVTSVSTSGNVSGITLTGSVTTSGTLTLGGAIGTLNQNTTGSSGSCTGNAATASTVSGVATTMGTSGSALNTSYAGQAGPQVYGNGGGGAVWSMHRPGAFGLNIGLDSDNVFRIGGWSASTNRFQMDMTGNLTMAGNVTAYSDERLKKDWAELPDDFIVRLAEIKHGTFTRLDGGLRQVGVSAQSLQNLLPEAVIEQSGYLSVAYGNAALAAVIELSKRVLELEKRLNKI